MGGLHDAAPRASRVVDHACWVGQDYVRIHLVFFIFVLYDLALIRNAALFPISDRVAEVLGIDEALDDFALPLSETLDLKFFEENWCSSGPSTVSWAGSGLVDRRSSIVP
jgi:hypothetical protein